MLIVQKVLVFALMFAILIVLREIGLFALSYIKQKPMEMSMKRQIILGVAISYILTIIFTGFKIL